LAFPDVQPLMQEVIACNHFLDALGDPDFAMKIRERQPTNLELDSALRIALQLEAWTVDTTRRHEATTNEQGELFQVRKVLNGIVDSIKAFQVKVEKKFTELERRIPKKLNNGGSNNGRQTHSNRHTAPNVYSGVSSTSSSLHGPHPANCGQPNNFVRPLSVDGAKCNGNSNRLPSCRRISHLNRQDQAASRAAKEFEQKTVRSEHRSTHSKQRHHQEKAEQCPANLKQIGPLVEVDKQAIQNSRTGSKTISIGEQSEPSTRPMNKHRGEVFEQQKWHQRPLAAKNKAAYSSKAKVSAPIPTQHVTEPTTDALQNRVKEQQKRTTDALHQVDKQHGTTEVTPQRVSRTKQEMLKELDKARKKLVEITQQEDCQNQL